MDRKPVLLDYRKSTKQEAREVFFGISVTVVVLGAIFIAIGLILKSWLLMLAAIFICIAVAGAGYAYSHINAHADDEFRCVLTHEKITCHCPVAGCGESFSLKVAEITVIEHEYSGDDRGRYYLCGPKGNRHWLTSNYDNPVGEIIEHLMSLNPDITMLQTNNL